MEFKLKLGFNLNSIDNCLYKDNQLYTGVYTSDDGDNIYTYVNGLLHSLNDQPAWTDSRNDIKVWYNNGMIHREGSAAWFKRISGSMVECWYKDDMLHRVDGPAYIDEDWNIFEWHQNGALHRLDGPARITLDHKEWWINDVHITYELVEWAKEVGIDLDNLTEDDKTLIILMFAK